MFLDGWVDGWIDGWMDGWMDGWIEVKAVLRIAYSNQKWNCRSLMLIVLINHSLLNNLLL
jgi:hypothetical protein